ncbi:hypothetical protein PF005_g25587 [Phytophthora fragariae]|uniref:Pectate lyase n=1 Tax=Phytophthora fragariae TaxID=53985 RepID=A0A6A3QDJ1_9STRA|nr:hypothetical protein PF003_g3821 [Phytophthora fragariae]KAE8923490.1 hypothetical protein PF009_g26261 [Phytophthora fragariae]KAE8975755.1 hypothetical protein PF011_g24341 [Phytophthora fragariae]KAE9072197.1 hypothetical protein PF010_g25580 [Phytophthora fragariae]KAE9073924.1 hypothetical protein PF007_g25614 [Phytophthora fragariae]
MCSTVHVLARICQVIFVVTLSVTLHAGDACSVWLKNSLRSYTCTVVPLHMRTHTFTYPVISDRRNGRYGSQSAQKTVDPLSNRLVTLLRILRGTTVVQYTNNTISGCRRDVPDSFYRYFARINH